MTVNSPPGVLLVTVARRVRLWLFAATFVAAFCASYFASIHYRRIEESDIGLSCMAVLELPCVVVGWLVAHVGGEAGRALIEFVVKVGDQVIPSAFTAGVWAVLAGVLFRKPRHGESERYKSKKAAQPGATDNPDDAQRLREDY